MSLLFAAGLAPLVQPWGLIAASCRHSGQRQGVKRRERAHAVLVLRARQLLVHRLELYAGFRPDKSEVLLAKIRTWGESHTDQIIIIGCLVLGFWLIGHSVYLIVT